MVTLLPAPVLIAMSEPVRVSPVSANVRSVPAAVLTVITSPSPLPMAVLPFRAEAPFNVVVPFTVVLPVTVAFTATSRLPLVVTLLPAPVLIAMSEPVRVSPVSASTRLVPAAVLTVITSPSPLPMLVLPFKFAVPSTTDVPVTVTMPFLALSIVLVVAPSNHVNDRPLAPWLMNRSAPRTFSAAVDPLVAEPRRILPLPASLYVMPYSAPMRSLNERRRTMSAPVIRSTSSANVPVAFRPRTESAPLVVVPRTSTVTLSPVPVF